MQGNNGKKENVVFNYEVEENNFDGKLLPI